MTEEAQEAMTLVVYSICEELTDAELAALNIVAQLGTDPYNRLFDYNTVSPLFTENNGTRMHQATKDAVARITMMRLSKAIQ